MRLKLTLLFFIGLFYAQGELCLGIDLNPRFQVQDFSIFEKKLPGSWSGGAIEAPQSLIPIDVAESYQGAPSLRFRIAEPYQFWLTILAGEGWKTNSLAPYWDQGYLILNVKGAEGAEHFTLTLKDRVPGRNPESLSATINIQDYLEPSKEWQELKIPLRKIISPALLQQGFQLSQWWTLEIGEDYSNAKGKMFWINRPRFVTEAEEASSPLFKFNQLGYLPQSSKIAYVSAFPHRFPAITSSHFWVRRANDKKIISGGVMKLVSPDETLVSGEKIYQLDLSSLSLPGLYQIAIPLAKGELLSPAFAIESKLYQEVIRDASRYFYYQRQGIALTEPYAEGFARGLGHPLDTQAKRRFNQESIDVSQGWYDAGDYGKYVSFAAGPIADLLDAYNSNPRAFGDGSLNIPESGNGIPDLMDELRWELDWLLKMQNPEQGGFYHLVYPHNCPEQKSCRPEEIEEQRWVEDRDNQGNLMLPTATTAKAAAALAKAAASFRAFDADYSRRLLQAAYRAWDYLEQHPENIDADDLNGSQNEDQQERFWAAAELYKTTGEERFLKAVKPYLKKFQFLFDERQENLGAIAWRAYLAYFNSKPRPIQDFFAFWPRYQQWRQQQLERTKQPWMSFLQYGDPKAEHDFYWGSNFVLLQSANMILLLDKAFAPAIQPQDSKQALWQQLNYVFGHNPLSLSFVTGYGSHRVQKIYSHIYSFDFQEGLPKGYLVEGANAYQGRAYSRFLGRCYLDTNSDWTVSEQAIYYNAGLVLSLALATRP